MKEIFEQTKKLNQEIGYKQAEIIRYKEQFGEDTELIKILKEQIKEREEQVKILNQAENILLGFINWK